MTQRYHAFDGLRGVVMWLGIVIHVACNHMAGESLIPWRDTQTSQLADFITILLHTFRMPVFFILAGFFGALLLYKLGSRGVLINRAKRLALPFAIFLPFILLSSMILAQLFLTKMHLGYAQFDLDTLFTRNDRPLINTLHLWFLYYLILFFVTALAANKYCQKISSPIKSKFISIFTTLATRWWGFIVLTLPLIGAGVLYPVGIVTPDGSLIPNIGEYLHNGMFFLFGWLFFLNKEQLMQHYEKKCWRYTAAGSVIFFIVLVIFGMIDQGKMNPEYQSLTVAFTYNLVTWFWSLALIGIFIRYFSKPSATLRYLADSSYWVYLIHITGTAGFGILLYDTDLSLIPKMLVNIGLTTTACLISYHLFIRNTAIGQLLNGRRLGRCSASQKHNLTTRNT